MTNPVDCFTRWRVKVSLCNLDLASKIANVLMVVVARRRISRSSCYFLNLSRQELEKSKNI